MNWSVRVCGLGNFSFSVLFWGNWWDLGMGFLRTKDWDWVRI
jgi:hypothetical protein